MSAPVSKTRRPKWPSVVPGLDHRRDLEIACPDVRRCRAAIGEECHGLPVGTVHFGRRLKRILAGTGK